MKKCAEVLLLNICASILVPVLGLSSFAAKMLAVALEKMILLGASLNLC